MTANFKVGDRVASTEYVDQKGKFHPKFHGLTVTQVQRVEFPRPYYRVTAHPEDLAMHPFNLLEACEDAFVADPVTTCPICHQDDCTHQDS